MKCSESWLMEWVNPNRTLEAICVDLTMGGLEVEEIIPAADVFTHVVVGQIVKMGPHPNGDRLKICEVDVAQNQTLHVVCGAPNVKLGLKVPVALINATLPGNLTIQPSNIRGVPSEGMLCSAKELGLSEDSQGLLELPADAPLGEDLRKYLNLNDFIIDISITPNRGDCLSIKGIAREIAALTQSSIKEVGFTPVKPSVKDVLPIDVSAKAECPRYVGRVIRNIHMDIETPIWLSERLKRSGVRSINPVVDVTNYVMLEMGQPMHAFDLAKVRQGIYVRSANEGEQVHLLDDTEKTLRAGSLVIADAEQVLAIAGVMGGMSSGVTALTQDIFLESAFFSPQTIAKQRQLYGLNSESAYRFERGVDPTIQRHAIERATQLIIEIAGGKAGPIVEEIQTSFLPQEKTITLRHEKMTKVLGISIPDTEVESILNLLNFKWEQHKNAWLVHVPPYRFDLHLQEDLIEEVARIYGYDNIPTHPLKAELQVDSNPALKELGNLRLSFRDLGYHEIISYSFIDKSLHELFSPQEKAKELLNPITSDMSVMRSSLWPGLVRTLQYNQSRQQHKVSLFEIGTVFLTRNKLIEQKRLGGLMTGPALPEQWGIPPRKADFYDLKGHLEQNLGAYFHTGVIFQPEIHPALHPGQSARIYHKDTAIGWAGALHPLIQQKLGLSTPVYLFEMDLHEDIQKAGYPYCEVSKFPEIRRDIAILVNDTVPAKAIQDTIKKVAGDWLKEVFIFDVYQGKGISTGLKSIALGLILQHPTRTLVDEEVMKLMESIISALKGNLGAELRS